MSLNKGIVQAPTNISFSDGDDANIILGKQAEQLISPLHNGHYTQTYRGYVFHHSTTPLGLAIPIYTSTAPLVALWNPIGSGKNFNLLGVQIAYTSGTADYGALGLMYETNAGSMVATGAVFSAFAATTPTNGMVGGGNTSVAKVSISGTNTLTTAGAAARWFYTLGGINLEAQTGTAHVTMATPGLYNISGGILLPPGTAIWIACTKASSALYAQTLSWAEVPS